MTRSSCFQSEHEARRGKKSAVKLFLLGLSVQEDIFDKCTLNNGGGGGLPRSGAQEVLLYCCYLNNV